MSLLRSAFVAIVTAVPLLCQGNAVIGTSVSPPAPWAPGTTVTMQIRVTSNTTGIVPTVFAFRMSYSRESVRFLNASAAWAGSVLTGPETAVGVGPNRFVDIVGFSFGNANPTPTLANVRFVVGNFAGTGTPVSPFAITVADNPGTSLTLTDNADVLIPHVFDFTGSSNLEITGAADTDQDGLSDDQEGLLSTDPTRRDTDGDGIEDGVEVAIGEDPLVADAYTDADGDGLPVPDDTDDSNPDVDGDKIADGYEVAFGTNPSNPASRPVLGNVNGDGQVDFADGILMMKVFLGISSPTALMIPRAFDVNRDGFQDNVDATLVINLFLGKIGAIPLPKPLK